MAKFQNYIEIAETLQGRTMTALRTAGLAASFGCSNVSSSRYIEVSRETTDADGDEQTEIFRLRFSDHEDRHGSDLTIRFEQHVVEHRDDCGELDDLEIDDWRLSDMVEEAVSAAKGWRAL